MKLNKETTVTFSSSTSLSELLLQKCKVNLKSIDFYRTESRIYKRGVNIFQVSVAFDVLWGISKQFSKIIGFSFSQRELFKNNRRYFPNLLWVGICVGSQSINNNYRNLYSIRVYVSANTRYLEATILCCVIT